MPELATLQHHFVDWLLEGDEGFAADVLDDGRLPLATRLGIYRNAYRVRLQEALMDSYPALHTLLGDARFEALTLDYIQAHPSAFRSIRWFGDRMAEHLRTHADYRDQPVVAEMALFEWSLRSVFDAADATPMEQAVLAALAPERWAGLRLAFHPSLRSLELEWNPVRLWQAIDAGEPPLAPQRADYPMSWILWRRELRSYFRSLEVDEAWALAQMRAGADFASVCAGLSEWIDEANVPARAASFIAGWLQEGLLIDYSG